MFLEPPYIDVMIIDVNLAIFPVNGKLHLGYYGAPPTIRVADTCLYPRGTLAGMTTTSRNARNFNAASGISKVKINARRGDSKFAILFGSGCWLQTRLKPLDMH